VMAWELDTGRQAFWAKTLDSNKNWIFGNGTLLEDDGNGRATVSNLHSMYVQILYELGFCGVFVLLLSFLYAVMKSIRVMFKCPLPEKWLAYALIALPMVIGLAESLPLAGNSISTVWWGMGLGLLDRLDSLQSAETIEKRAGGRTDTWLLAKANSSRPIVFRS
jgi:hypothetical protein